MQPTCVFCDQPTTEQHRQDILETYGAFLTDFEQAPRVGMREEVLAAQHMHDHAIVEILDYDRESMHVCHSCALDLLPESDVRLYFLNRQEELIADVAYHSQALSFVSDQLQHLSA